MAKRKYDRTPLRMPLPLEDALRGAMQTPPPPKAPKRPKPAPAAKKPANPAPKRKRGRPIGS